jgi:hypothetical protein
MRKWLLIALAAGALHAAIIRGTVVEHQTGRVLARALVVITPVQGSAGPALSVRTSSYGVFEFPPVPAGAYLVSASRRGFAPTHYGQKHWKAAGVPIVLEEAASTFLSIRMPRFGSIAGTILDENDVGLPEHEVVVYRNARPPQFLQRVQTDDRGMYRAFGLEPGKYLVRTVGKQYEEGGYLPTFHKETATVEQAFAVEVELDRQTDDVNVRPAPGRLFTLGGQALVPTVPPSPATLTLVSDTGSEMVSSDSSGAFQFPPTAPGQYELYAQAPGGRTGALAAYVPLMLDRDRRDIRIALGQLPSVQFVFEDGKGQAIDSRSLQVMARRKDLSGDGKPETLRLTRDRVSLLPGRWNVTLAPTPAYCVAGFSGPKPDGLERGRPDGWNEIVIAGGGLPVVKFVLSSSPGSIGGAVTASGQDPVAGAPVYLEAYDPDQRKRLGDVRMVRTDVRGQYQFPGLPPGHYRVVSSFEFQMPDSMTMEAAGARAAKVEEGRALVQNLDLYVSR